MKDLTYLNIAGLLFDFGGLSPLKELTKLSELYVVKQYWPEAEALKADNPHLVINGSL